ncbi:PilZ domain-containing protein [bacterium]|nr:PilZ domain-containing protein [bacterium]
MSSPERRRLPRVRCRFRAELYILFPEETFRPIPYMCQVADVSQSGMKVQVPNLPQDQYRLLLTSVRFARIIVRGGERKAKVYCRIVWIGERKDSDGRGFHELGLFFEKNERNTQPDIQFIVERAREAGNADSGELSPHQTFPEGDE